MAAGTASFVSLAVPSKMKKHDTIDRPLYFTFMAQLQLKRPDEARKTLAEAADLAKTKLPKLESSALVEDWPEWLIAHILLREAKALMEAQPAAASDQPQQK